MSYVSIFECAGDPDFRSRVAACAVQEGAAAAGSGESFAFQWAMWIAARPDVEKAWEYSVGASPYHSRRGYDPAVITDQMILDAVRAIRDGGEASVHGEA